MTIYIERTRLFPALLALAFLWSCGSKPAETVADDPLKMTYTLRGAWPHEMTSFTQGLLIHKGELYESTGQEGKSWIGIVDIKTGIPAKKVELKSAYFGEGITIFNNKVYQLTWTSKVGFVYDLKSFQKLRDFDVAGEGWGMTHDSTHLIMSEGSDKLLFLDTTSFQVVRTLKVKDPAGPVKQLNELEYIDGYVYANIWQTNTIVKIDPATGEVKGRLDLSPLASQARNANPNIDVLNGIAWHPDTRLMLVTGKYWPYIYILKINDTKAAPTATK